jgi:hypothetical protein
METTEWRNESKQARPMNGEMKASKQTNKSMENTQTQHPVVLKFAAEQPAIPNLTVSVQYETERDRQIFNYELNS